MKAVQKCWPDKVKPIGTKENSTFLLSFFREKCHFNSTKTGRKKSHENEAAPYSITNVSERHIPEWIEKNPSSIFQAVCATLIFSSKA